MDSIGITIYIEGDRVMGDVVLIRGPATAATKAPSAQGGKFENGSFLLSVPLLLVVVDASLLLLLRGCSS